MDLWQKYARTVLIYLNLALMIPGICLIYYGGIVIYKSHGGSLGSVLTTIPIMVVMLGSVIFFVSLIGFYGAYKENNCLSLIYSVLTLSLLTLQVLLLIYVHIDRRKIDKDADLTVEKAWEARGETKNLSFILIQEWFGCCGKNGKNDYPNDFIPASCCMNRKKKKGCIKFYEEGCKKRVKSFINVHLNDIKYTLIAVGALEIIVFSLGCYISGRPEDLEIISLAN